MKAIFLNESTSHHSAVYTPSTVARLRRSSDLDETLYTKAKLLADPARFTDVDIIFSTWGMPSLSEEEIRACLPGLKCLFYAAGSVQGFARPFLSCGVRVFSAWAANAVPVAEYTLSQIILANKDFFCQTMLLKQQRFEDAAQRRGSHLGNFQKKVGLIGCGMIGSLVAEMLKGFDLDVLAYDPFLSADKARSLHVTPCSLDELFSSCAVVSNHLANNRATQKMLRYEHFASMVPYATFINTGRGAQVVEEDLVRALTERPDLTAVLDVTDPEPPLPDHPFYTLPNCFLTPHIAGSLGGERARMAEYMAEELEKYRAGLNCPYEVTLQMLETMA